MPKQTRYYLNALFLLVLLGAATDAEILRGELLEVAGTNEAFLGEHGDDISKK